MGTDGAMNPVVIKKTGEGLIAPVEMAFRPGFFLDKNELCG